jgi:hypothetical protein
MSGSASWGYFNCALVIHYDPPLSIYPSPGWLDWNPWYQGLGIAKLTLESLYDFRRLRQGIHQVTDSPNCGLIAVSVCSLN